MRVVAACLLSAMAISAAEISGAADLSAMSEDEIEAMSDDVRIPAEELEEEAFANADEAADAGAQTSMTRSLPGGWDYCKKTTCGLGEGDCDKNRECGTGLVCGCNNCDPKLGYHALADCCEELKPFHFDYCKLMDCGHGDGDCDCHAQCGPGLKCGVNNCRRMHPLNKDIKKGTDCCTRCSSVKVGPPGMYVKVDAEYWSPAKEVVGADRTLVQPPAVLEDAAVWNLRSLTDADEIKIKCCRYKKDKCEFFVTVYHCKPCSEDHNGGLPGHLLSSGWDAGSCAPRFSLPGDMSGTTHAMTTYHRTLSPGESEVIPISKNAPHVAVFERTGLIVGPWCDKPSGPFPPPSGGASGPGCACIPSLLGM